MRIDDDDRKIGRDKRMDLIRRYQEEQAKLDQGGGNESAKLDLKKLEQLSPGELVKEIQKLTEKLDQATKVDESKSAEKRGDIQATELNQQLMRTEVQHQVDGTSRTSEAVDAAHKQQSRGESWQKFEAQNQTEIPQSVEEKARTEKEELEKDNVERQEKDRQSVRELQNEMAVRQRRIRS